MRSFAKQIIILLCCIILCSVPSNATSVNEGDNVNVEAPFATISDFCRSQKVVGKNDVLKYSFTISFVDSFDYKNLFYGATFRTGEYWVDVCWQSPKKQKIERTYECVEKNNALFIEDTIPIEKGMQAGDWQIMYIRISNLPEEGNILYFGHETEKDPNGYYNESSLYTDLSFTSFTVTRVNKKADNKAPTIELNSLKISDRYVKKSKKKKKVTFSVKIKDASSVETVESSWCGYNWGARGKEDDEEYYDDDYVMKYNKKTKRYQCTIEMYPESTRKMALYCIYVKDIYGNDKYYSIDLDTFAPGKKMRKYYNAYKRMIVSVK